VFSHVGAAIGRRRKGLRRLQQDERCGRARCRQLDADSTVSDGPRRL
jgi:hypothetical protein